MVAEESHSDLASASDSSQSLNVDKRKGKAKAFLNSEPCGEARKELEQLGCSKFDAEAPFPDRLGKEPSCRNIMTQKVSFSSLKPLVSLCVPNAPSENTSPKTRKQKLC